MKSSKNKPHRCIVNKEINEPHSHIGNIEGKNKQKIAEKKTMCLYVTMW